MKEVIFRYYDTLYGSEIRSALESDRSSLGAIVILREYDTRRTLSYVKKARSFFKKYFNYEPCVDDETIFVDTLYDLYEDCIRTSFSSIDVD